MQILIIDDNPADILMVREIFDTIEGIAYHAEVIKNGTDAIKYLTKAPPYQDVRTPNLIILDLNLPGRSGYDILQEMDKHDLRIPVIVYTTSDRPEDIKKAYRLRANCYVVKPADFTQLDNVLKLLGLFWLSVAKLPE